jgi:hypothetical protein
MIKKLYNPNASQDNLLKIHASDSGCCGSEAEKCTYTSAEIETINATAVKVKDKDGNTVTITFTSAATTVPQLKSQLAAAVASIGYDADGADWFSATQNEDDEWTVVLKGELEIVALVIGTDVAFTKEC